MKMIGQKMQMWNVDHAEHYKLCNKDIRTTGQTTALMFYGPGKIRGRT